jgi:hypothetical protein
MRSGSSRRVPGDLTVADLHAQRELRASVNHETYKQLLKQVQDRIRLRAGNDFRDLVWQVPPFVPGRPVFTASHAARYVSEKLRRGGFEVTVAAPSPDVQVLYITWRRPAAARPARDHRRRQQQQQQRSAAAEHHRQPPPPPPDGEAPVVQAALPASVAEATRRLERLKARLRL